MENRFLAKSLRHFISKVSRPSISLSIKENDQAPKDNLLNDGSSTCAIEELKCKILDPTRVEILVCTMDRKVLSIPIESLIIHYKEPEEVEFRSLVSALTYGLDSLVVNDQLYFENISMLDSSNNMRFILPFVKHPQKTSNLIDKTIYFFCVDNVRNKQVTFLLSQSKSISVFCGADYLVFHANSEVVNVTVSGRANTLRCYGYRAVKFAKNCRPFKLSQTREVSDWMGQVIADGIPTIVSGKSGSGKSTAVRRYCQAAGIPLVTYYCSESSTKDELWDSERNGVFADAFLNGKMLLMEGIEFIPAFLLKEMLDYISKRMIGGFPMHSHFRLIGTRQTNSVSTKEHLFRSYFRFINLGNNASANVLRNLLTPLFHSDDKINRILSVHNDSCTPRDCIYVWKLANSIPPSSNVDPFQCAIKMVYNVNMDTFPVIDQPIKFAADYLDRNCWNRVYTQIHYCLKAGCHILLVGKTERVARKYCAAIREEKLFDAGMICCSTSMSTESVLGKYTLEKNCVLRFFPSAFINSAQNGFVCKMLSIHLLPPAVVNRILPFLEKTVSTESIKVNLIERKDNPNFEISPDFIVLATTSEDGLQSMMPSLRDRFVVIHVGDENSSRFVKKVDINTASMFGSYKGYLEAKTADVIEQIKLYRSVSYLENMDISYDLKETIDCISEEKPLDYINDLKDEAPCMKELFYSLLQNRATVLHGPKSCGKTTLMTKLIEKCGIKNYKLVFLSKDTDFCELMGYLDKDGNEHDGLLKAAMEGDNLVVFENAENLSNELLERLEPILDPLVNSYWDENEILNISSNFRVLFLLTEMDPLPFAFPSYVRRVKMEMPSLETVKSWCSYVFTKDDKQDHASNDKLVDSPRYNKDFLDHFAEFAYSTVPVSEFFIFRDLCFQNNAFRICVALYADREDRSQLLQGMLEQWKTSDNNLQQLIKFTLDALRTTTIQINERKGRCSLLQRGQFSTICSIPKEELRNEDPSFLRSLFSLCVIGWNGKNTVLLVGENRALSHLTKLLYSKRIQIDCSRSTTYADFIGNGKYLSENLVSAMVHAESKMIVFQNLDYLNEQMRSRIYSLLFHFKDLELSSTGTTFLSTCSENHLGMIENSDQFIQIHCSFLAPQANNQFGFVTKTECSLPVLQKAEQIKKFFKQRTIIPPLFVMCLESDLNNRTELLSRCEGFNDYDILLSYFSECDDQFDVNQLNELFTDDVTGIVHTYMSDLPCSRLYIQMLISFFLAHQCRLPLIFELERGKEIDLGSIINCVKNNNEVYWFEFYRSTTEEELFEFLPKDQTEPTIIFFFMLDNAEKNLQRKVYNLLSHLEKGEPAFLNSESVSLSPNTFFICTTQTHSLYPKFYEKCMIHKVIMDTTSDLKLLPDSPLKSKLKSLMNRDPICQSEYVNKWNLFTTSYSDDTDILWLIVACNKPKAERKAVEAILGYPPCEDVVIVRNQTGCIIKGIFEVPVQCNPEDDFDEWSLTTTERDTLFKIEAAMLLWRFSLMLVGDQFSGRMYVISMLAKMERKELLVISLDSEISEENMKGTLFLTDEEGRKCSEDCTIQKALEKGSWIFIQGIEKASYKVVEYIKQLCQEQIDGAFYANTNDHLSFSTQVVPKFNSFARIIIPVGEDTRDGLGFNDCCVSIYCDSIATQRDVQEMYLILNPGCDASIFGEEEATCFEKCQYVIHSQQPDIFAHVFETQPTVHPIVAEKMNLHSYEYKIYDILSWSNSQLASKRLAEYIIDLYRTDAQHSSSILVLLRQVRDKLCNQFVVVLINLYLSLKNGENQNSNEKNEVIHYLDRWLLVPAFSPFPKSNCNLLKTPNIPLNECFNCSSCELLKMIFLCPHRNHELLPLLKHKDLSDFTTEVFEYIDRNIKDFIDPSLFQSIFESLDVIQTEFNSMPTHLEVFLLQPLDFQNWIGKSMNRVEQAIAMLPTALQNSSHLEAVHIEFVKFRDCVQDQILKGFIDWEETQRSQYESVMKAVQERQSVQQLIAQSFPNGRIPDSVAEALIKCRNEDCEDVYEYNSEKNKMVVRASHLLYKLQCSKNYLYILSEYSDILSQYLHIRITDVIQRFQYIFLIAPSLIVLLNVVLKQLLQNLNWKDLVAHCGDYPFLLPEEKSESDMRSALQVLIDFGCYSDWLSHKPTVSAKEMKELLLSELYRPTDSMVPKQFALQSVVLVRAIDNEKSLDKLSYQHVACPEIWWDASFPYKVSSNVVIPPLVLQMERSLVTQKRQISKNEETIWEHDCKLSMNEKLHILCARRQTLLGRIILDALDNDDLKEAMLQSLHQQNTVEKVFGNHIIILRNKFQQSYGSINQMLIAKRKEIKDAQSDIQNRENQARQLKDTVFESCQRVIDELNADETKRMNTLNTFCFMMAVNNLSPKDICGDLTRLVFMQRKLAANFEFTNRYEPFSMQAVWVSKTVHCNKITVKAPQGMEPYAPSFTINVNSKILKRVLKYNDGYVFVLPYAPFKWICEVEIEAVSKEPKSRSTVIPADPEGSASDSNGDASSPPTSDPHMSTTLPSTSAQSSASNPFAFSMPPFLDIFYNFDSMVLRRIKYSIFSGCQSNADVVPMLKLLQCMTYVKQVSGFQYVLPDFSEEAAVQYFSSITPPDAIQSHSFFISNSRFSLFYDSNATPIACASVDNASDLTPILIHENEICMHWEVPYILHIPRDLNRIQVVCEDPNIELDNASIEDYNHRLQVIADKAAVIASLQSEERNIEVHLQEKKALEDDFLKYYLPNVTEHATHPNISLILQDALFVFFDGQQISIALPENRRFVAPDNVIGHDGNELWLPLIRGNSLLSVQLSSRDCQVIQKENGFMLIVKEKKDGINELHVDVSANYCGPKKVSAIEKFTIVFHHGREENSAAVNNIIASPCASYDDISRYFDSLKNKDVNQFVYHFSYILSFILCASKEENRNKLLDIVESIAENKELCKSLRDEAQSVLQALNQSVELKWNYKNLMQYQAVTRRFSKMTKKNTLEQFKYIYERSDDIDVTKRSGNRSTKTEIKTIEVQPTHAKLPRPILRTIFSQSSQLVIKMRELLEEKQESTIHLILDANCSMSRETRRTRSIVISILITLCEECGFCYRLFVPCGQNKMVELVNPSQNIEEMYSMIFDMEFLKIIDSCPFDLLSANLRFKRDDFFFIISDGFCGNLLSTAKEINSLLASYPNVYLFFLAQTSKLLGKEDIRHLNDRINPKFDYGNKRFDIFTETDLLLYSDKLAQLPFTKSSREVIRDFQTIPALKLSGCWVDSFPEKWPCTKSMARVYRMEVQRRETLPVVAKGDINIKPVHQDVDIVASIDRMIPSGNLVDAFCNTLFSTSIPAQVIYASEGRSVSYSRYLQFISDSRVPFFSLSVPSIQTCCAVSIVVDCSFRSFSLLNRQHALFTVFSVLRNLSAMDISCADVWLANEQTTRVATGISVDELWSNDILDPIYEASLHPFNSTALVHTIQMAGATCMQRDLPMVMLVMTNGVVEEKTRMEIQDAVTNMKVRAVGIGIGSYLTKFSHILPEMVWNANPLHLADSINNLLTPNSFDVENGVMQAECEEDAKFEREVVVHQQEIIEIMKNIA